MMSSRIVTNVDAVRWAMTAVADPRSSGGCWVADVIPTPTTVAAWEAGSKASSIRPERTARSMHRPGKRSTTGATTFSRYSPVTTSGSGEELAAEWTNWLRLRARALQTATARTDTPRRAASSHAHLRALRLAGEPSTPTTTGRSGLSTPVEGWTAPVTGAPALESMMTPCL